MERPPDASLLQLLLTLLIIAWGFSLMLRPLLGAPSGARRARMYTGDGMLKRLFLGLLFSVMLPVAWWSVALVGRGYARGFVVFAEFLSGVHDWNSYRTSLYKFAGAVLGFVAYNALIVLILLLVVSSRGLHRWMLWPGVISGSIAVVCGTGGRQCLRRMP